MGRYRRFHYLLMYAWTETCDMRTTCHTEKQCSYIAPSVQCKTGCFVFFCLFKELSAHFCVRNGWSSLLRYVWLWSVCCSRVTLKRIHCLIEAALWLENGRFIVLLRFYCVCVFVGGTNFEFSGGKLRKSACWPYHGQSAQRYWTK